MCVVVLDLRPRSSIISAIHPIIGMKSSTIYSRTIKQPRFLSSDTACACISAPHFGQVILVSPHLSLFLFLKLPTFRQLSRLFRGRIIPGVSGGGRLMTRDQQLIDIIQKTSDPEEAIKIAVEVVLAALARYAAETGDHPADPPAAT